ncbi:uncharacterized protein LOC112091910 [Morus notabilis]|uniref:uncharacterized protein LOC112091910 n=1 Tax=Morus notabilis TaxID=981085 RepID=UPI000CED631B|nr:uncharacterized protein LOC112091910 [Morus notabilis]
MTWEQFETIFNEQYFPRSYRDENAMEFMSLLQGDMSVREYEAKFNNLSWFAPSLVESKHLRCLKFEKGGPQWSGRRNHNQGHISREMISGGSSSSGSDRSGPYRPKCHHCGQIPPPQQYRLGTQRPNIGDKEKGKAQGQTYTLIRGSSGGQATNTVVEGMIMISHSLAHVLFDTGATYSFISSSFVETLKLKSENLETPMMLNSPLGCMEVASICRSCEIMIGGKRLRADLIILPMSLFDVVLKMDWLARYGAIVDCYRRRVTLMTHSGTVITYQTDMNPVLEERLLRYSVGGRRNLACFSFLLALEGEPEVMGDNVGIPVVDEFAYVFSDELLGLPPDQEIEFGIDLIPGTTPISIPPY